MAARKETLVGYARLDGGFPDTSRREPVRPGSDAKPAECNERVDASDAAPRIDSEAPKSGIRLVPPQRSMGAALSAPALPTGVEAAKPKPTQTKPTETKS